MSAPSGWLACPRSALESHTDPVFLAPDDAALPGGIIGVDDQHEFLRDSDRTADFECGAGVGKIANGAGDACAATERYRSGFQYPMPRRSPALIHGFTRYHHGPPP